MKGVGTDIGVIHFVGIGGIGLANAAAVILAGADGIAVVSAIVSATCPQTAAQQLRQAITISPS